jgi:hypothetical protein
VTYLLPLTPTDTPNEMRLALNDLYGASGNLIPITNPAFGGVADGVTDNIPALVLALASASAGDTIVFPPAGDGEYFLDGTIPWDKSVNLAFANATLSLSASVGKIQVEASRVCIIGTGGELKHIPAEGAQTTGHLFFTKPADSDFGNYSNWWIERGTYTNVSLRFTRAERQSARGALTFTNLSDDITTGTTWPVNTTNPFVIGDYVTVLNDTDLTADVAVTDTRLITGKTSSTLTVASGLTAGAPQARRVQLVTRTDGVTLAGATTIQVEKAAVFEEDCYFRVYDPIGGTYFLSLVEEVDTIDNEILLATPTTFEIPDETTVTPLGDGTVSTGTDIVSHVTLNHIEARHCRANYTIEIGGVDTATLLGPHVHDILRYKDPDDARYFTEATPASSALALSFGECLKITAASRNVKVHGGTIERFARNAADWYDGAHGEMKGVTVRRSLYAAAIELKYYSTDANTPAIVRIQGCLFEDLWSDGIIAGAPHSIITNNTFIRWGLKGTGRAVYINGGGDAIFADDGAGVSITNDVNVSHNSFYGSANGAITDTGILATEATGFVLNANTITDCYYPIWLHLGSSYGTVTSNTALRATSGQHIRLRGTAGIETRHRVANNTSGDAGGWNTDAAFPISYSTLNGFGIETGTELGGAALGVGATPTIGKWTVGDDVMNATDSKIRKKTSSAAWSTAFN